jgi:CO/xanthine dehydrogenase Mo-binding subunit
MQVTQQETSQESVGKPVKRKEDLRLLKGIAGFVDDVEFPDQLYAAILFSSYAHAKIKRVDTSKAEKIPGVVYVLTGAEVATRTKPPDFVYLSKPLTSQYILAVDKVRYMGEPVAAVAATSRYIAHDALEAIDVEYEPLPLVRTIEDALKEGSPLIYDELKSNKVLHDKLEYGDPNFAFENAHMIIKERFKIHRYSSTPLETYVINAHFDVTRDELVIYANDSGPGRAPGNVGRILGIPSSKIHMYIPTIGGSFGNKGAMPRFEAIISLLSIITGRPVKWVQRRFESLYGPHRPRGYVDAELALSAEGKALAINLVDWEADGTYPTNVGVYSLIKFANMCGQYKIRNYSFEFTSVATNDPPVQQDRGVGKPFMNFIIERLMDIAAKKLNISPVEIRNRNFIKPSEMPYTTPSGEVYESGNYPGVFQRALELSDYEGWKKKQIEMRSKGRYIGIGLACGIEPGTSNHGYHHIASGGSSTTSGAGQMATVEMLSDGTLKSYMNGPEVGTGHATSISQVIGSIFNVPPERVIVDIRFDSQIGHLIYAGTFSNAFNDVYIGAVVTAAKRLKEKVLRIAAFRLGVKSSELIMSNGYIEATSANGKRISFRDVAMLAYNGLLDIPPNEEPGLRSIAAYRNPFAKQARREEFNVQLTHSNSTHVALVEVSPENGSVRILNYSIVHDAGNVINPAIVEGMIIGATASGIGGALYEEYVFDENENNLSITFGEYLKPTALEVPDMEIVQMQTPAPNTVLGTKATGEGGAITSLGAIANAVEDALSPFDVKITELPITPEKVVHMLLEAKKELRKERSLTKKKEPEG